MRVWHHQKEQRAVTSTKVVRGRWSVRRRVKAGIPDKQQEEWFSMVLSKGPATGNGLNYASRKQGPDGRWQQGKKPGRKTEMRGCNQFGKRYMVHTRKCAKPETLEMKVSTV